MTGNRQRLIRGPGGIDWPSKNARIRAWVRTGQNEMTVDKGASWETPAVQGGRAPDRGTMALRRAWPVRALIPVATLLFGVGAGWWAHDRLGARLQSEAPAQAAAVDRSDSRSQFEIERDAAVRARLNRHPWAEPGCVKDREPCALWHALLTQQRIERDGQRFDVFVYGSGYRESEGHSTKAPISMVETDAKGKVVHAHVDFTEGGIYGQPQMNGERYTVIPLDEHAYAVAIEESDMHFGLVDETLSVHLFVDGKLRGVFSGPIGADYDESSSTRSTWKGGWTLIQVPKSGPELLITKRGIQDGKPLDTIERYRWDGKAFTLLALPATESVAASAAAAASNEASNSATPSAPGAASDPTR